MTVCALLQNDLSWRQSPGFVERLSNYLFNNVAETKVGASYPELETRVYSLEKSALKEHVEYAVNELGWKIQKSFDGGNTLHATVTTPMFKFMDDIEITLEADAGNNTHVQLKAASRVGKGDLGTNTRHILNFYQTLDDRLTTI